MGGIAEQGDRALPPAVERVALEERVEAQVLVGCVADDVVDEGVKDAEVGLQPGPRRRALDRSRLCIAAADVEARSFASSGATIDRDAEVPVDIGRGGLPEAHLDPAAEVLRAG